jgi:hypothetical protein
MMFLLAIKMIIYINMNFQTLLKQIQISKMLYIYIKIIITMYNNKFFLIIRMDFKYKQIIEIIKYKMNSILMKKYLIKIL